MKFKILIIVFGNEFSQVFFLKETEELEYYEEKMFQKIKILLESKEYHIIKSYPSYH